MGVLRFHLDLSPVVSWCICFISCVSEHRNLPHCLLTSVSQGPSWLPHPTSPLHNHPAAVPVANLLYFFYSVVQIPERRVHILSAYLLMSGCGSLACLLPAQQPRVRCLLALIQFTVRRKGQVLWALHRRGEWLSLSLVHLEKGPSVGCALGEVGLLAFNETPVCDAIWWEKGEWPVV